ncbi:cytochrome C [Pelagibaculum spongiae]|uniref:Cytochrome C n=2 Tax=Pelagibaculum spongiae TaxID=2080658 RepID=A0A2V1GQ81_9GAMM|nr:cytochrome C [Pelagibaculum spongiae]
MSVMLSASFLMASEAIADDKSFSPYVDTQGNISLPDDFRISMVHLGSWFVPEGAASGFHDVYTEKSSAQAYRKTGKFPDGATLVKELRASKTGDYTTGQGVGHAVTDVKQWFVMIKDAKGRFSDNKIWGEGWGWGLYKPDNRSKNVSSNYKADCLGCHLPAKNTDLVYVGAYPTLGK